MLADYVERYVRGPGVICCLPIPRKNSNKTRALVAPAQRSSQTKAAKLS